MYPIVIKMNWINRTWNTRIFETKFYISMIRFQWTMCTNCLVDAQAVLALCDYKCQEVGLNLNARFRQQVKIYQILIKQSLKYSGSEEADRVAKETA